MKWTSMWHFPVIIFRSFLEAPAMSGIPGLYLGPGTPAVPLSFFWNRMPVFLFFWHLWMWGCFVLYGPEVLVDDVKMYSKQTPHSIC